MNCEVRGRLFDVIHLLEENQRLPRQYGQQLLYHAEAAFLGAVQAFPDANMSDMSEHLRITKGAVTQLYTKLASKGLVATYARSGNRKEKYFRLTPEGEAVRLAYMRFHQQSNQALCEYFRTLTARDAQIVLTFLDRLKDCVPFCESECICLTQGEGKEVIHHEQNTAECPSCTCNA